MAERDIKGAGQFASARRGALGLSQEQLASRAQVDPKTIASLESGRHWPWARNVAKIEAALDLPPMALEKVARGGDAQDAVKRVPDGDDLVPQCTVEKVVIETEGLPEAMKRDFVRVHRLRGHSADCNPFAPGESQPQSALASLSAAAL